MTRRRGDTEKSSDQLVFSVSPRLRVNGTPLSKLPAGTPQHHLRQHRADRRTEEYHYLGRAEEARGDPNEGAQPGPYYRHHDAFSHQFLAGLPMM